MRRLIQVQSAAQARQSIAAELPHTSGGALLIASTRRAGDELLWSAAQSGLLAIHRLTLKTLAAQLAAPVLAEQGWAPLSPLAAEAVAARTAFELQSERKLRYFRPVADTPGFVRAVTRTIRELRLEQISPARLSRGTDAAKDLAALLRRYSAICEEQRLADEAHVLQLATEAAAAGPYQGLPLLWLDAPLWDRSAAGLAAALIRSAPRAVAAIQEHDTETLEAMRTLFGVLPEPPSVDGSSALAQARIRVFTTEAAAPTDPDESVQYFAAPGESLESVEIARRIRDAAAAGLPFDRIAVLLRHSGYQPYVEEALGRAGIPAYYSRGTTRPDPAGRAFLALLHCAADSLSASQFAQYLSLAQVPDQAAAVPDSLPGLAEWTGEDDAMPTDTASEEPTVPAPYLWERLLVDAAVREGAERWARRLDGLAAELAIQAAQAGDEPERAASLERRRRQLELLRAFALPLIERLAGFPASAPWGDWLPRLDDLALAGLRHPSGVRQVLKELEPMALVGPVTLAEVIVVLSERLGTLRREPPARRFGQVFVGSLEEVRGLPFALVLVPGLAEGIFPQGAVEDPLFLDESRRTIDLGLPTRSVLTQRERLLLRIALGAGDRLIFSYPTMDTSLGRGRVPSLYALEVLRAAFGELPRLSELESHARRQSAVRLGWPAPADPAQAIDQTEFDLAMLGSLDPQSPRPGLGRFLVTTNAHAARSLRARYKRWERRDWSDADGMHLVSAAGTALLAPWRLTQRAYSATALQQFAICPYRFFLSAIAQLEPREEAARVEQLDPLTRGELFHTTQHELFLALEPLGLLPWRKADLDQVSALADQILDTVAARYHELLAPAIESVWQGDVEALRIDLRGWLREVALKDQGWVPVHSEWPFGDDAASPVQIGAGFRLRGRIDWIETRNGELRITDHKTGRRFDDDDEPVTVGRGEVLQPVLYALAAQQQLGQRAAAGRLYFCTQRGGYHETEIAIRPVVIDRAERLLAAVDGAIDRGELIAAPRPEACDYCTYRPVCGPSEERRTRRKATPPWLTEIRSFR